MDIREMVPDDYPKAHALWESCPGMRLNSLDDSREGFERFIGRNPATCFVAEQSGELVGTVMAGDDGRRAYLYHMAVHPAFRRRGIGRELVGHALEALRGRGVAKVALVVFAGNDAGNAFWEQMGFTRREDLVYRNLALAEMKVLDT